MPGHNRFLKYYEYGGITGEDSGRVPAFGPGGMKGEGEDELPPVFDEAYKYIAPNPDAEYGKGVLGFVASNKVGSPTWVQEGANTRASIPDWLRKGLKGALDWSAGTQTGEVTGSGLETLFNAGNVAGLSGSPAGAIGSGATRPNFRGYRDAPADKLTDWPWRPLSQVAKDMPTEIPQHVLAYGDFMRDQVKKLSAQGLDTRDALKAYLTTLASMQRQAIGREALPDLKLTSSDRLIRPEGAYSDWLGSKWGQKYLEHAVQGEAHPDAIKNAVQNMTPFGFQNLLGRQMTAAPQIVPGTEAALADQVNRASRGIRSPSQWAAATDPYEGIDAAKKGFFGSMIGYGDRPTLDARQLNLHTLDPDRAKNVMRRVDGGEQAVQRLADRQRALNFSIPSEYDPYYQHLAHHTIWDAVGGSKTTHKDIIDMMLNRAEGGQVPEFGAGGMPGEGEDNSLPSEFGEAYKYLAPNPDAQYGTSPFGFVASNREGSPSWVQEGANTRPSIPDWLRKGLTGAVDWAAGTQTGEVTPRAVSTLMDASTLGNAPAGALSANSGPGIQWIKNLLGWGSTAEKNAMAEVAEHARQTGKEMSVVGRSGDHPSDLLRSYGDSKKVTLPTGWKPLQLEAAKDDRMVFTAHPHPSAPPVPSAGDMKGWANDFYVPQFNKQGTFLSPSQMARERMWIAGIKGPQDAVLVPPMPYTGTSEDYGLLRRIRDIDSKHQMKVTDPVTPDAKQHFTNLSNAYWKFLPAHVDAKNWTPEQHKEMFGSLLHGDKAQQYGKEIEFMMDPATQMMKGYPDLKYGDVHPEWQKLLYDRGVDTFKAEGGQVPAYGEGGFNEDESTRHSIPYGQFSLPQPPTPTFNVPIGKGEATAGFNYDMINKLIDAQLGYEHPVGKHGARLGVSGNFNKYVGEGGNEVKPNWGVNLRLNVPFAEGGQYDPYEDIMEAQRLMGAYK